VILGGRVMDPETGFDQVANVGIKDGRIAAITRWKIEGAKAIDANGLVVAPGFIDTHWHYDRPWSNKLAQRDGRTTVVAHFSCKCARSLQQLLLRDLPRGFSPG
jgi:N-acyl-D-glutamate deacylase